ncbi:hypothetical protein HHI36_003369 [Cryptolaemus montrouzieri]|uniref:Uncharacterized protein n=1 Tax=Cryptolaemus montrouzieri TaxID=559131 RepID=A0ABD2PDP6_9CUCU
MDKKASVRRSERYNLVIPPNRLGYGDDVDNAIGMNRKKYSEKASSDIVNLKDHSVRMEEFQNEIPNSPTNRTTVKDQSGNVKSAHSSRQSSKFNVLKLNLELKKLHGKKQFEEDMLRKQEEMLRKRMEFDLKKLEIEEQLLEE